MNKICNKFNTNLKNAFDFFIISKLYGFCTYFYFKRNKVGLYLTFVRLFVCLSQLVFNYSFVQSKESKAES